MKSTQVAEAIVTLFAPLAKARARRRGTDISDIRCGLAPACGQNPEQGRERGSRLRGDTSHPRGRPPAARPPRRTPPAHLRARQHRRQASAHAILCRFPCIHHVLFSLQGWKESAAKRNYISGTTSRGLSGEALLHPESTREDRVRTCPSEARCVAPRTGRLLCVTTSRFENGAEHSHPDTSLFRAALDKPWHATASRVFRKFQDLILRLGFRSTVSVTETVSRLCCPDLFE